MEYSEHANAERILRDGWELFQQKGYLGVSIADICHSCGITKPTLYYYFKNKENLFVEVLLRRLKGFHAVIEQGGSLEERLVRISASMFDSFKVDYSFIVRDLEHIKSKENSFRIRTAFSEELFVPISNLMQTAVDEGRLCRDARFNAQLFMGIVESFITRAGEYEMDNLVLAEKLVGFFLKGAGI